MSGVRFRKYIDNVSIVNPWEKLECVFIQMSEVSFDGNADRSHPIG